MYMGIGESMKKNIERGKKQEAFPPVGGVGERSEPEPPTGDGQADQGVHSPSSPEVSANCVSQSLTRSALHFVGLLLVILPRHCFTRNLE